MNCKFWRFAALSTPLVVGACRPEFKLNDLTTNESLYSASLNQYQLHHWDNAIAGFEKLTSDLPPRDTLLPRSYWHLASAHEHQDEYLIAAQSYGRLLETFPDDSLADDAGLEAARSYRKLWRKPQLDPTYGLTALSSYNTLIGLYPNSPLIPTAQKEIGQLENWFAIKDFDAGDYYFRLKFYDSANIFFREILAKWPNSPTARDAGLRLVESYRAIRYTADASELCAQLRTKYPLDRGVQKTCRGVPEAAVPPKPSVDSTRIKPPV